MALIEAAAGMRRAQKRKRSAPSRSRHSHQQQRRTAPRSNRCRSRSNRPHRRAAIRRGFARGFGGRTASVDKARHRWGRTATGAFRCGGTAPRQVPYASPAVRLSHATRCRLSRGKAASAAAASARPMCTVREGSVARRRRQRRLRWRQRIESVAVGRGRLPQFCEIETKPLRIKKISAPTWRATGHDSARHPHDDADITDWKPCASPQKENEKEGSS